MGSATRRADRLDGAGGFTLSKAYDPYKRHKTRHSGVTYRIRKNGSRAYYVFSDGRQQAVKGGEAEAIARQAELRTMAARGQRVVATKAKFAEIATEWLASKHKLLARTLEDYEADLSNRILPRFGHRKPAQITADSVASFIRELEIEEELSGARIKNILKPLRGTLDLAVRRGLIAVNPLSLLTSDERPKATEREHHIWAPEEITSLLEESSKLSRKPTSHYDYSALLAVAIYTGLRISEILALRWQDIDLKGECLTVRHQLSRKGAALVEPKTRAGKRRVPLASEMVSLLTKHKLGSTYSTEEAFVFASRVGTALNARNVVRRGFEPALEAAGLRPIDPKITFHDLRHAFASIMIERGTTSVELATVMGHRDSRTTERIYIHLFNRAKMEARVRAAMQEAMRL